MMASDVAHWCHRPHSALICVRSRRVGAIAYTHVSLLFLPPFPTLFPLALWRSLFSLPSKKMRRDYCKCEREKDSCVMKESATDFFFWRRNAFTGSVFPNPHKTNTPAARKKKCGQRKTGTRSRGAWKACWSKKPRREL